MKRRQGRAKQPQHSSNRIPQRFDVTRLGVGPPVVGSLLGNVERLAAAYLRLSMDAFSDTHHTHTYVRTCVLADLTSCVRGDGEPDGLPPFCSTGVDVFEHHNGGALVADVFEQHNGGALVAEYSQLAIERGLGTERAAAVPDCAEASALAQDIYYCKRPVAAGNRLHGALDYVLDLPTSILLAARLAWLCPPTMPGGAQPDHPTAERLCADLGASIRYAVGEFNVSCDSSPSSYLNEVHRVIHSGRSALPVRRDDNGDLIYPLQFFIEEYCIATAAAIVATRDALVRLNAAFEAAQAAFNASPLPATRRIDVLFEALAAAVWMPRGWNKARLSGYDNHIATALAEPTKEVVDALVAQAVCVRAAVAEHNASDYQAKWLSSDINPLLATLWVVTESAASADSLREWRQHTNDKKRNEAYAAVWYDAGESLNRDPTSDDLTEHLLCKFDGDEARLQRYLAPCACDGPTLCEHCHRGAEDHMRLWGVPVWALEHYEAAVKHACADVRTHSERILARGAPQSALEGIPPATTRLVDKLRSGVIHTSSAKDGHSRRRCVMRGVASAHATAAVAAETVAGFAEARAWAFVAERTSKPSLDTPEGRLSYVARQFCTGVPRGTRMEVNSRGARKAELKGKAAAPDAATAASSEVVERRPVLDARYFAKLSLREDVVDLGDLVGAYRHRTVPDELTLLQRRIDDEGMENMGGLFVRHTDKPKGGWLNRIKNPSSGCHGWRFVPRAHVARVAVLCHVVALGA